MALESLADIATPARPSIALDSQASSLERFFVREADLCYAADSALCQGESTDNSTAVC